MKNDTYERREILYEDAQYIIYRGYSVEEDQFVVIKTFVNEESSKSKYNVLEEEYNLLKDLKLTHTIVPISFSRSSYHECIIWNNFEGSSLKGWINKNKKPEIDIFLKIALGLVNCVEEIHAAGYLLNNINSYNFLLNSNSHVVKFIGTSEVLNKKKLYKKKDFDKNVDLQYLQYTSPEHLNEVQSIVSEQSNIYSIGIILYECLTGVLPFFNKNYSELIYAHVALLPPSINNYRAQTPDAVSQIISKCLHKNWSQRYQSIYALKKDIEICLELFEKDPKIRNFDIGGIDKTPEFKTVKNIFGREKILKEISFFLNNRKGNVSQVILISGEAGIGKTSTLQHLHHMLKRSKNHIITGKFDQFSESLPYIAIRSSIKQLLDQIISRGPYRVDLLREKFKEMNPNYKNYLQDLFPETTIIFGHKERIIEKRFVTNTQRIVQLSLYQFFKILTENDMVIILSLDDLQWMDAESLSILEFIFIRKPLKGVMFIGAYRSKQNQTPPKLSFFLESLHQQGIDTYNVVLERLEKQNILELLLALFENRIEEVGDLAQLLSIKTHGNPFFINQFLTYIYRQGYLFFNYQDEKWIWNKEKTKMTVATKNVVDLLALQLQGLSFQSREILNYAACFGHKIFFELLFELCDEEESALRNRLLELISSGIIMQYSECNSGGKELYSFSHDKFIETIYSLISDKRKAEIHQQIAFFLLKNKSEINVIDIGFHVNRSVNIPAKIIQEINLEAGNRANKSGAYQIAYEFFKFGVETISIETWDKVYLMAFQLYMGKARCAYIVGNNDEANYLFDYLYAKSRNNLDRARVINVRMELNSNAGLYKQVIKDGLKALELLGVNLRFSRSKWKLWKEYLLYKVRQTKIKKVLQGHEDFRAKERKVFLVQEIVSNMIPASYYNNSELFILLTLKMVNYSFINGLTSVSPIFFSTLSVVEGAVFSNYKWGYILAKQSQKMGRREKTEDFNVEAKLFFALGAMISPWVKDIKYSYKQFEEGFTSGQAQGDFEYASYSIFYLGLYSFYEGRSVSDVEKKLKVALEYVKEVNCNDILKSIEVTSLFLQSLKKKLTNFNSLSWVQKIEASENSATVAQLYLNKFQYLFLMEETDKCEEFLEKCIQFESFYVGLVQSSEFVFYYSLFLLGKSQWSRKEKDAFKKNRRLLKKWALSCPNNFLCKQLIIEAELRKKQGATNEALEIFEKSILAAQTQENIFLEALAHYLNGRERFEKGYLSSARLYLNTAKKLYYRWGAYALVDKLEEKYSLLFLDRNVHVNKTGEEFFREEDSKTKQLIQLSEDILNEGKYDQLFNRILKLMTQISGAQKGAIIFKQNGEFYVPAKFDFEQKGYQYAVNSQEKVTLTNTLDLSKILINLVSEYKVVILKEDLHEDPLFFGDKYIKSNKPKVVIGIPLLKNQELMGVLYIENKDVDIHVSEENISLLENISKIITLAIDRMFMMESLKGLNTELQQKLIESQLLYEKIEKLGHQAALANLTKGIAHEIKNPIHNIKMSLSNIREDLDRVLQYNSSSHEIESWKGRVNPKNLLQFCGKIDRAEHLFITLKEYGYLTETGALASSFDPGKLDYNFSLPHGYSSEAPAIDLYLRNLYLKKMYWELIAILDEECNRIVCTTSAMLKYGEVGKRITNSAFSEIMSFQDSTKVWLELVNRGYLDENGFVGQNFKPEQLQYTLGLSKKYEPYEKAIISIIQQNPFAIRRPINMNDLLMSVLDCCRGRLKREQISMSTNFEDVGEVLGNDDALRQCFVNILDNSMEALLGKPNTSRKLFITTSLHKPDEKNLKENDNILIEIMDTGIGIEKSMLSRIRDPFFSTKKDSTSLNVGLGLPFIYQVVDSHGGTTEITSVEGVSTMVKITLPCC